MRFPMRRLQGLLLILPVLLLLLAAPTVLERKGWAPGGVPDPTAAQPAAAQPPSPAEPPVTAAVTAFTPPCDKPGWFPQEVRLKDHHVFWYKGSFYLVSIDASNETRFAYARSQNLCEWQELTPILEERSPGGPDDHAIWAPHVYREGDVYYLYYTGVNTAGSQSILLATSSDPADPASWQPQGVVFQPSHPGTNWTPDRGGDCRDPAVAKVGDVYYLYYTGIDLNGGIIGLATASSPRGPWKDWGAIVSPEPQGTPESPALVLHEDVSYLFYNLASQGERYRIGASPSGPWQDPIPFSPGWAHEFWEGPGKVVFASYLTDYTVTISPLEWSDHQEFPRPSIGASAYQQILPLVNNPGSSE